MFAEVIVDVTNSEVDRVFDYKIPDSFLVSAGDLVRVPFGKRTIDGFVLKTKSSTDYPIDKVKEVSKVIIGRIIKPDILNLILQLKNQLFLKYVDVIKLVLPSEIRNGKTRTQYNRLIHLNKDVNLEEYINNLPKNSRNPIALINFLQQQGECNYTELSKKYGNSVVCKLLNDKICIEDKIIKYRSIKFQKRDNKDIIPNIYQQSAIDTITKSDYNKFLLFGVTGSGKTEVYIRCIKNCLAKGKTAIMLVPEISLTPQMISIFGSIFGDDVALLHSGLSVGEKFDEWNRIYEGKAKIVIGARSAIFAPIDNLGIIIIDEEHDNSYISDSNPRYETNKVADIRARYNNCPLVLGSATPNIETYYKSETGEITRLELPTRANNKALPNIDIIDMLPEFRSGNTSEFSQILLSELAKSVERKNQAMIFINRRGFSSYVSCRNCGYIPRCTSCDITLSYHKECNELKCHYCGKRFKAITKCPECGSDEIKFGGVGTQRVVQDLQELFPNVPIIRMDVDNTRNKDSYANILNEFGKTKPSILVGTQMIAKGHDFPAVDLVGILDADLSLYFGEYRAAEKTFQLITQVAGRSGRSEAEGKVILQTYFPKNYVYNLVASYNYKAFYNKEINLRKTTNFPPFAQVTRILISSESQEKARENTRIVFEKLKQIKLEYKNKIYYFQAMQSPQNKLKDKYRYQVIFRYSIDIAEKVLKEIYAILSDSTNSKTSIFVENNPLSLS